MKLTQLRPILWTENLEETLRFYTEILEFTLGEKNLEWQWASLFKDDVHLMLATPNSHTPFEKSVFTGSFYFNTDDVEVLWKKLKDKTKICYPIEVFEWEMKEFAIYDNNGYILQFGQPTTFNK
ncbi:VOC family protein [Algoriphagus sanaruensis]|uniref:Glyoxalase n=1 Tax=Algoriphagus sanaruensis TaxID=1727163 RepID=A0A142ERH6_9BACT|nr:VOC family protein [Algoriphagus sanaruensis]AMQ57731.1 glyoxalase [Algoriphagus sanaruensis]